MQGSTRKAPAHSFGAHGVFNALNLNICTKLTKWHTCLSAANISTNFSEALAYPWPTDCATVLALQTRVWKTGQEAIKIPLVKSEIKAGNNNLPSGLRPATISACFWTWTCPFAGTDPILLTVNEIAWHHSPFRYTVSSSTQVRRVLITNILKLAARCMCLPSRV